MDLVTCCIFLLSFALCTGLVFFVSVYGAKERTFEEALEEKKRKLFSEKNGGKKIGVVSSVLVQNKKKTKFSSKKKSNDPSILTETEFAEDSQEIVSLPTKVETINSALKIDVSSSNSKVEQIDPPKRAEVIDSSKKLNVIDPPKKVEVDPLFSSVELKVHSKDEVNPSSVNGVIPSKLNKKNTNIDDSVIKEDKSYKNKKFDKVTMKEVISIVKNLTMDDGECQHLIDLLLNKQVGHSNGDWIENSTTSNASSSKALKKLIADKETELEEANSRTKNMYDRMVVLRQELNAFKALNSNAQRIAEEAQGNHKKELNALQCRLQQQIDAQHREITNLQTLLQMQLKRTQQLEATVTQYASVPQVDESILNDLRMSKDSFESQVNILQSTLSIEVEEKNQFKSQLNSVSTSLTDLEHQNYQLKDELTSNKNFLEETLKSLESYKIHNDSLSKQIEDYSRSTSEKTHRIDELSAVIETSDRKMSEIVKKLTLVSEENERLSEQLAASVFERPKAEGQESSSHGELNGHEENNFNEEQQNEWKNKFNLLCDEKENLIHQHKIIISELQNQVEATNEQLSDITKELNNQKNKNDELRMKNKKAVEALHATEEELKKQSHNLDNFDSSFARIKNEMEVSQKQFLKRLFPTIHVSDSNWCQDYENGIKAQLSNIEHLEKDVSHYKQTLKKTEELLEILENRVTLEEVHWKMTRAKQDEEIKALQSERDVLLNKASSLNGALQQAEEAQMKLTELELKVSSGEIEKNRLIKELTVVQEEKKKCDDLYKEVKTLNDILKDERQQKNELAEKLVKMNQIISTADITETTRAAAAATPASHTTEASDVATVDLTPSIVSVTSLSISEKSQSKKKSKKKKK